MTALDLIKQLFVLWFFAGCSYVTGNLLLNAMGRANLAKYANLFFSMLTGFVILVAGYSVIRSGMQTVNLLFILPFLFYCRYTKVTFRKPVLNFKWALLPELILVSVFLVVLFNLPESRIIQADSTYYLKIAEGLRLAGYENTHHFMNLYDRDFHGVEAYHFFELWSGALLMQLFDKLLTSFALFRVVDQALIMLIVVAGMFAIAESIANRFTIWLKIFALVFCLFFLPDYIDNFPALKKFFYYPIESNPFVRPNFRTYWLFMLPATWFILNKKSLHFFLALLLLPVISITTAPAVYAAAFLLLLASLKFKIWENGFSFKKGAVILIANVLLLFLVLTIFSIKNIEPYYHFTIDRIVAYYKTNYKAVIFLMVTTTLNVLVLYLPFFILFSLFYRKQVKAFFRENKFLAGFSALILLTGIVCFQALSFMSNTYQFAFIGYIAVCILLFVYMVYLSTAAPVKSAVITLCFSAFMLLYASYAGMFAQPSVFKAEGLTKGESYYSPEYLSGIDAYFEKEKYHIASGAYIADTTYYKQRPYSHRMPDVYFVPVSYYIASKYSYNYEFCLSSEEDIFYKLDRTSLNSLYLKFYYDSGLFKRFMLDKNVSGLTKDAAIVAFLKKFRIAYLILTKNVEINESLLPLISKVITDEKTEEKFLILK